MTRRGGTTMKKIIPIAPFAALMLAGCVTDSWQAGPTVNRAVTQEQVAAQCRMMARRGGTGVAAAGSVGFVAGAAIGNGIANGVNAAMDFDDCMIVSGYVKTARE